MKVLIVDDNPQERKLLRVYLERERWEVTEAANGQEGVRQADAVFPNVIISDGMMPDMDGYQFLREIRRGLHADILFIFYSGIYTGKEEQELALALGADAVVQKPEPPRNLVALVRELVQREPRAPGERPFIADEAEYLRKYSDILQRNLKKRLEEIHARPRRQEPLSPAALKEPVAEVGPLERYVRSVIPDPSHLVPPLPGMPGIGGHIEKLQEPLLVIRGACSDLSDSCGEVLQGQGTVYVRQIASSTEKMEKLLQQVLRLQVVRPVEVHEPLRRIRIFRQMLSDEYSAAGSTVLAEKVEEIGYALSVMEMMVSDILDLAAATRIPLRREPVDLVALARVAAERLVRGGGGRSAFFVFPPELWTEGDRNLLRMLMDNLLENSWRYTAGSRAARIELGFLNEGRREYFVRDNGEGFDPGAAETIFDPFSRLHSRSDTPGTGLGLAVVKVVAERHGGIVRAEGEKGRGSTIFFTLG